MMAARSSPTIPYVGWPAAAGSLRPRMKLLLVLPVIAAFVLVLVYFQLFASPIVIAVILVLYVAVSLRNRRKFDREQARR